MTTYASSRATLAAALAVACPEWTVFDHPSDAIRDYTIAISPQRPLRMTAGRWVREMIVGVFVHRDALADAFDRLDAIIPTVCDTLLDAGCAVPDDPSEVRPVTVGGVEYLAQFVNIQIETTTT